MGMRYLKRCVYLVLVAATIAGSSGCAPREQTVEPVDWSDARQRMVTEQLAGRDIRSSGVLAVMGRVPRHLFVPSNLEAHAYDDSPLPIGEGQTISQPYIVALMTELADPQAGAKLLEVGTGSGYQAAVLAELGAEVYTIELLAPLAREAAARLERLGYATKVHVRTGDGYLGWPEAAPFDAILVTCGAIDVPEPLFQQLKPGGKIVIPVGPQSAHVLRVIEKDQQGRRRSRDVIPVRFVPLRRQEEIDRRG